MSKQLTISSTFSAFALVLLCLFSAAGMIAEPTASSPVEWMQVSAQADTAADLPA